MMTAAGEPFSNLSISKTFAIQPGPDRGEPGQRVEALRSGESSRPSSPAGNERGSRATSVASRGRGEGMRGSTGEARSRSKPSAPASAHSEEIREMTTNSDEDSGKDSGESWEKLVEYSPEREGRSSEPSRAPRGEVRGSRAPKKHGRQSTSSKSSSSNSRDDPRKTRGRQPDVKRRREDER